MLSSQDGETNYKGNVMLGKTAILFEAENGIQDKNSMQHVLTQFYMYCLEAGYATPPLPENIIKYVPFNFRVTATENSKGEYVATYQIKSPANDVLNENTWVLRRLNV